MKLDTFSLVEQKVSVRVVHLFRANRARESIKGRGKTRLLSAVKDGHQMDVAAHKHAFSDIPVQPTKIKGLEENKID